MLDLAPDVDLVLVPPSQLPVSLVASTSVASISGCQYQLPVSLAASTSVASVALQLPVPLPQLLVPLYQLPVPRLLVPKLPVPLPRLPVYTGTLAGVQVCAMVAKDITKPVAEDSCETIVEDTHESSTKKMSCIQTLITSNNNRSRYM